MAQVDFARYGTLCVERCGDGSAKVDSIADHPFITGFHGFYQRLTGLGIRVEHRKGAAIQLLSSDFL